MSASHPSTAWRFACYYADLWRQSFTQRDIRKRSWARFELVTVHVVACLIGFLIILVTYVLTHG